MSLTKEQVLSQLETIRKEQGEEAYTKARHNLAIMLLGTPEGERFLTETFPDLDLEPVREEVAKRLAFSPKDMVALVRAYVPSIQTQVQFDLFMAMFNSLTATLDFYFSGKHELGDRTKDALIQGLDLARRINDLGQQVGEIPVEERSSKAEAFVQAPKQFTEIEDQRRLLAELAAITDTPALNTWYATNRARLDGVVTKKYRDELFDAIRKRFSDLGA